MERGERRHTHTQIHKKGRTICDGLEPCDWSGDRVQVTGRGFCLFVCLFYPITGDVHRGGKLLQSGGVISIHVRRRESDSGRKKKERKERQRERKQNKRHTIRKLKIFEIHNVVSFCTTTKKRGQQVDRQSVNPVSQFFHSSTAVHI